MEPSEAREVRTGAADGGADHHPDMADRRARFAGIPPGLVAARHLVEDRLADDPAVGGAGVLHLRPLGVAGQRQHVDAAPGTAGQLDRAVQRAEAEVRADRDRVGGQRSSVAEVRGRVRVHGGADVAALDVQQRERADLAEVGQHPLEHGDPGGAVGLEERRLRLEHRHLRSDRLDQSSGEALDPAGVAGQTPGAQQRRMWIDADAQRAALGGALGQPPSVRLHTHRSSWSRDSGRDPRVRRLRASTKPGPP